MEQDNDAPTLYRVHGLQSSYGQTLNGMLCTTHGAADDYEERLQCWVDGEPKMMAIKKVNLLRLSPHERSWETFRMCLMFRIDRVEREYKVKWGLIRESDGESFDFSKLPYIENQDQHPTVEGLLPISIGNFLKDNNIRNVLIKSDCLETCKLINYHSIGFSDVALLDDQKQILDKASDNGRLTFFASFRKYLPHLVSPELPLGQNKSWRRRLDAVKAGLFDIYPCPLEAYREFCLEVRFFSLDGLDTYQEICRIATPVPSFSLYKSESSTYPETMANADPSSFWNLIKHLIDTNTVHNESDETLESLAFRRSAISKWRGLYAGLRKANLAAGVGVSSISQSRFNFPRDKLQLLELPSDAIRVAWALSVIPNMSAAHYDINGPRIPPLDSPIVSSIQRDVKHQLLPCYYDSALEEALLCLATDGCADATSDFFIDPFENSLKSKCNCCGSRENLLECDGCGRVVYCSRDCQKARWHSHRNLCASKRCP